MTLLKPNIRHDAALRTEQNRDGPSGLEGWKVISYLLDCLDDFVRNSLLANVLEK